GPQNRVEVDPGVVPEPGHQVGDGDSRDAVVGRVADDGPRAARVQGSHRSMSAHRRGARTVTSWFVAMSSLPRSPMVRRRSGSRSSSPTLSARSATSGYVATRPQPSRANSGMPPVSNTTNGTPTEAA